MGGADSDCASAYFLSQVVLFPTRLGKQTLPFLVIMTPGTPSFLRCLFLLLTVSQVTPTSAIAALTFAPVSSPCIVPALQVLPSFWHFFAQVPFLPLPLSTHAPH